jgi:hypothetical protein
VERNCVSESDELTDTGSWDVLDIRTVDTPAIFLKILGSSTSAARATQLHRGAIPRIER